jgi:hypothetical protein
MQSFRITKRRFNYRLVDSTKHLRRVLGRRSESGKQKKDERSSSSTGIRLDHPFYKSFL